MSQFTNLSLRPNNFTIVAPYIGTERKDARRKENGKVMESRL